MLNNQLHIVLRAEREQNGIKMKKVFNVITATILALTIWTLFIACVFSFFQGADLMTIIVGTFLLLVFAGSTTCDSIRAYLNGENKNESV